MNNIKYNILFVPKIKDRIKLGLIRRKICKKVFSTQAMQYPVHMSVISGGFHVTDYNKFEESLIGLLKKEKPFEIVSEGPNSFVLPEKFWTGIHINRNVDITNLQYKLQNIRNLYTEEKKDLKEGQLHITFAFPAKVDELKPIKLPVTKFFVDRITIVKKVGGEQASYKIHKHIKLDI